jgi:hypothetical protein
VLARPDVAAAAAAIQPIAAPRSSRFAVHQALKNIKFIGNSSFGGKADGTTMP